jgi:hypothetical protein
MKKPVMIRYIGILVGASLLAACGTAAMPTTNPTAPVTAAVASVVAAATDNPNSAPANSSSQKADACTFLSKDEVGQVLGQPVTDAVSSGLGGVCTYTSKDASVDLTVTHTGGIKYLEGLKAKIGDTILAVDGVGDAAVYNTFSSGLIFSKGDAAYIIGFSDLTHVMTPDDIQAKQKALAAVLLSHLP